MLATSFQPVSIKHALRQRHVSLAPGGGNRQSGGSGVVGFGSVRGPVFRGESGVECSSLKPLSIAGDVLGGMGPGFAVGGSRFIEAVAGTGPAGGSSGPSRGVGHVTGGPEYRGFAAGCRDSSLPLTQASDSGHGTHSVRGKGLVMKFPEVSIASPKA